MVFSFVIPFLSIFLSNFEYASRSPFSVIKLQNKSKIQIQIGKTLKLKATIPIQTYLDKGMKKGILTIKAIIFKNPPNNCTKKGASCSLF